MRESLMEGFARAVRNVWRGPQHVNDDRRHICSINVLRHALPLSTLERIMMGERRETTKITAFDTTTAAVTRLARGICLGPCTAT